MVVDFASKKTMVVDPTTTIISNFQIKFIEGVNCYGG
jgi:hypothetical protein